MKKLVLTALLFALFISCDQSNDPEFNLKADPADTIEINGSWTSVDSSFVTIMFDEGEFHQKSLFTEKKGIVEKTGENTINCYTVYAKMTSESEWTSYKDAGLDYPSIMPMEYEVSNNGNTLTLASVDGSGNPEVFTK